MDFFLNFYFNYCLCVCRAKRGSISNSAVGQFVYPDVGPIDMKIGTTKVFMFKAKKSY